MVQYPWDVVEMPIHTDEAGSITQAEVGKHVPFHIRHLYWIHDVALLPQMDGGYSTFHTNQLIIPLVGGCEVRLSDGLTLRSVSLEAKPYLNKAMGLWCKPGSWRDLNSPEAGTVLLVLSDQRPEDAGFIRDWSDFLDGVGKGKTRG